MLDLIEKERDVKNILSDKINIKDIMATLHVADVRAAMRWCKKKSILVLKFGKERYANLIDFELAIDRPFIESLKVKHPENWKEIYSAYKKNDYIAITEQMFQSEPTIKTKFEVKGEVANSFIKKIKQKLKENGRSKIIKE
ncbi:MAG: hypothetical protein A3F72_19935 [Bacteroidetes bacterium RIFCSPLOWO2_12_FULL_35_15]|nr:MAG: hypothetical protein A3F72_19935 [Bacteroidetes bacterium RIFCSPLOWO2_12_FULL_35_15]